MTPYFLLVYDIVILATLFLYLKSLYGNSAPFIPTPKEVIAAIVEEADIKDGDTVYELGCGNGRMLSALHKMYPRARYVGIEKELFPYLLAKARVAFMQSENIIIKRADLFLTDLSDADVIFTYLFPDVMQKMENRFAKTCKKGARLVSLDFFLPSTVAAKTRDLGRPEGKKGRFIFTYIF